MKIAFAISSLSTGGAERVCTLLCNQWVKDHEVHLITWQKANTSSYPLDERITHHPLNMMKSTNSIAAMIGNNIKRINALRRILRAQRPDVLVCFMLEVNVIGVVAARLEGIPIIISERVDPNSHRVSRLHQIARRLTCPCANRLVVQTKNIRNWFFSWGNVVVEVIPNPIDLSAFKPLLTNDKQSLKHIISIGRLVPQKGFDILIAAFAKITTKYPDWTLHIYGHGELYNSLYDQITALHLKDRIVLEGQTSNIAQALDQGNIYVSATRYEGFPNATLEACAAGLCVLSTDAPGAVREILCGGEAGLLSPVDDVEALAINMERVMTSPNLCRQLAQKAVNAAKRYDLPIVAEKWIELFQNLQ